MKYPNLAQAITDLFSACKVDRNWRGTGVSSKTLGRWEEGNTLPRRKEWRQFAQGAPRRVSEEDKENCERQLANIGLIVLRYRSGLQRKQPQSPSGPYEATVYEQPLLRHPNKSDDAPPANPELAIGGPCIEVNLPKLLREPEREPSHDRCDACGQLLGVIADLRPDRSIVSSGLRDFTWGYNRRLNEARSLRDPERVLSQYLLPSYEYSREPNERVAIMSGIDYPDDRTFSESGSLVASHYLDAFGSNRIERVENLEDVKPDDALVLFASHQGHPKSREYAGDPRAHSPVHHVKIRRAIAYEAELPWAIFTREGARDIRILQTRNGEPFLHKTKEHSIHYLNGTTIGSEAGKDGAHDVWLDDYLLITALPTDGTKQRRVISFIGLHLTGTLAAAKLLREISPEILNPIHRKLAGHPYFQALISLEVDNTQSSLGRARPGRVKDVRVEEIIIRNVGDKR